MAKPSLVFHYSIAFKVALGHAFEIWPSSAPKGILEFDFGSPY